MLKLSCQRLGSKKIVHTHRYSSLQIKLKWIKILQILVKIYLSEMFANFSENLFKWNVRKL